MRPNPYGPYSGQTQQDLTEKYMQQYQQYQQSGGANANADLMLLNQLWNYNMGNMANNLQTNLQTAYSPTRSTNYGSTAASMSAMLASKYNGMVPPAAGSGNTMGSLSGLNLTTGTGGPPSSSITSNQYKSNTNSAIETMRSLEKLTSPSVSPFVTPGATTSTSSPSSNYDRSSLMNKGFYQYLSEGPAPLTSNYMSGGTILNADNNARPLIIPPAMSSRPKSSSGTHHQNMSSPHQNMSSPQQQHQQQQQQMHRNNSPLNLNSASNSANGQKIKIHSINSGGDKNSSNSNKEVLVQTVTSAISNRDSPPPSIIVRNTNITPSAVAMAERQKKLDAQVKTNNIGIHYPGQKKSTMETLPSDIDMQSIMNTMKSTYGTTLTPATSAAGGTRPSSNSAVGTIKVIPQNLLKANPNSGAPIPTAVIKNNIRTVSCGLIYICLMYF
jgi:hypothetical protein